MSTLSIAQFSGILPRVPAALLPQTAATVAENCDFGYGELRGMKGGALLTAVSNAVKSLYTEDGVSFYTWDVDVDAVRAPMAKDQFRRVYYTTPTDFLVTVSTGTRPDGGPPGSSYRVGVPKPTAAPTFSVTGTPVSLADVTIAAKFHWEYSGVKYQEQDIALTTVTDKKKWTFTPPAKNTGAAFGPTDESFIATAYSIMVPVGGGDGPSIVETWFTLPVGTRVIATASDTLRKTADNSLIELVVHVKDDAGRVHAVDTLYSLTRFSYLNDNAPAAGNLTPEQAFPVIRLIGASISTGATAFDIYSNNSAFLVRGNWDAALTRNDAAESYTLVLASNADAAQTETRSYVYTYVNTYGEEGPPSPAGSLNLINGLAVDVSLTLNGFGGVAYAPIKEIRVYRTMYGSNVADFFYAGSALVLGQPPGAYTFHDDVAVAALNETLSSDHYYPPDPALVGLMCLKNGILCAWKGNEVHFSEAYKPWAWPPEYVKTFQHNVVGGVPYGSGVLLTTTTEPVILSGVTPSGMTESSPNVAQAGVSKHSIAIVDGFAAFASPDGIVVVAGGQASLALSQRFFTRDVWRARYGAHLSAMRFSVWDGRLVVYAEDNSFPAFMILLDEAAGNMSDMPAFQATCTFASEFADGVYYGLGSALYQFNAGAALAAVWESREMVIPAPLNFGYAKVLCNGSWSVEFRAYDEGSGQWVLRHTKAATGPAKFRLPAGYKSQRYRVRIAWTGIFQELRMGELAISLKEV